MTVLLQIVPNAGAAARPPLLTESDTEIFSVLADAGMVPTLKYRTR